jgi:hypothetical protein
MQQRLGIADRIGSPDVPSLSPVDESRRSRSAPSRATDGAGTIEHPPVASRRSTRAAKRPLRRRTRRPGRP